MTALLLRLFVSKIPRGDDPATRGRVGMLSGIVGILCNFLLFLMKLAVGTLTGSVSITADAMNNLSDASSSVVTLLGFHLAKKPADEDHPYGHARFEYLSALAVAAMILIIGFELAKTSVEKIISPETVVFTLPAALVLVASISVKLWLSLFNGRLGRLISSSALLAAATDSRNDCIATLAVLTAAGAEHFLHLPVDGYVGLAVALFILWSGVKLGRETIPPLLGEAASPELRSLIVDYISAQPGVLGYHDLMVHDYGPGQRFATIHVEMDFHEDPLLCHQRIDDMERECLRSHNIHLVIHHDPMVTDDPELNEKKARVTELLREYDNRLTIHDFQMVRGDECREVFFDVSLPEDLQGQEGDIRRRLEQTLNRDGEPGCRTVITFDPAERSDG